MFDAEKVRIWKIISSEIDYIAGFTLVHALKEYLSMTDNLIFDLGDTDEIEEIPRDKWDEYRVRLDEDNEHFMSFTEYMNSELASYGVFCSTAY